MANIIEIHNFLPHRQPMLMVDFIIDIDSQTVTTQFEIKQDTLFIEDTHFAAVGLIENAAQTCSSIVAKTFFDSDDVTNKNDVEVIGFISAIKSLKIHSLPETGKIITTKATLVSRFDTPTYTTCVMDCTTYCDGVLLLEGVINLFIQEQQNENK